MPRKPSHSPRSRMARTVPPASVVPVSKPISPSRVSHRNPFSKRQQALDYLTAVRKSTSVSKIQDNPFLSLSTEEKQLIFRLIPHTGSSIPGPDVRVVAAILCEPSRVVRLRRLSALWETERARRPAFISKRHPEHRKERVEKKKKEPIVPEEQDSVQDQVVENRTRVMDALARRAKNGIFQEEIALLHSPSLSLKDRQKIARNLLEYSIRVINQSEIGVFKKYFPSNPTFDVLIPLAEVYYHAKPAHRKWLARQMIGAMVQGRRWYDSLSHVLELSAHLRRAHPKKFF